MLHLLVSTKLHLAPYQNKGSSSPRLWTSGLWERTTFQTPRRWLCLALLLRAVPCLASRCQHGKP